MCSRNWRIAMMVPWLAFVVMLVDIWRAYDRLPAVMASHFNAAGLANGWAPKQQVMFTIVGITFGLLCLFTFLLSRFPQINGLGWLVMVAEYWGIGILAGITHGTLRVGIGEARTLDFPIGIWSLIMGGALVVGEFGRIRVIRKRADADHGQFIAQERHSSPVMAMVMVFAVVGTLALEILLDLRGPARVVPTVVAAILLGCAVWAFTGFQYRVTTTGLEIRMLGLPIRFVPAMDIQSVRAKECNPLTDFGGWGIRGIGKMRAYIWGGHRCVYVQTHAGDQIYLGIRDADRMVRELESMTPVTHR
jgi:hypothetical protein